MRYRRGRRGYHCSPRCACLLSVCRCWCWPVCWPTVQGNPFSVTQHQYVDLHRVHTEVQTFGSQKIGQRLAGSDNALIHKYSNPPPPPAHPSPQHRELNVPLLPPRSHIQTIMPFSLLKYIHGHRCDTSPPILPTQRNRDGDRERCIYEDTERDTPPPPAPHGQPCVKSG